MRFSEPPPTPAALGRWRGHALTWQLWVDNVFNHAYWSDTGSAWGDSYLFPGAPRLARLSVTVGL